MSPATTASSPVERVLAELDALTGPQEELYRHLHAHPELSMRETATAALVADRLHAAGYTVHRIGGGVVGVLANGHGPTVLARADMDALPVAERTGLPYASTVTAPGPDGVEVPVMHACGHDLHVAAGLGAAELLAAAPAEWNGTCLALFQPGEETAEGGRSMVADGLVDRVPRPDVALAQHVLTSPVAGHVAVAAGPVLSTAASVRVTIHGTGSHGSMPHLSVDPVVIAASIVMRLQTLVSRRLPPGRFGVVTVGSVRAGSTANVIPDSAELLLNIRAYDDEARGLLLAGIADVVRSECQGAGTPRPPDIEQYESYPLTANDPATTERVADAFRAHFGPGRVEELAPVPASEDFSTIPDAFGTPYCYWGVGGFTPDQTVRPNHNPGFAPAIRPTLRTATEALVCASMAWLGRESRAAGGVQWGDHDEGDSQ